MPNWVTAKSNAYCAAACIDKNLTWCSESNTSYGRCYKDPKYIENRNICSSQTQSKALKLWSCPHTPASCGEEELLIGKDYERSFQFVGGNGGEKFLVKRASCRYKLMFPDTADQYDQLLLKVNKLTDAKLYTVSSPSYSSENYTEREAF